MNHKKFENDLNWRFLTTIYKSYIYSKKTTVFLACDSTLAPKLIEKRPETGWGENLDET